MADNEMIWQADAKQALAEMQKLIAQQKAMEAALMSSAKAGEQGAKIAQQAMEAQNAATKNLVSQNEKLKKKLDEIKEANKGASDPKIWAGLATTLTNKVATAFHQVLEQTIAFNKELAQTARTFDQLSRPVQVQALLQDRDMEKLMPKIYDIANQSGMRIEDVLPVVRDAMSSGLTTDQATGEGMRTLMMAAKGTNAKDIGGYVKSIMGVLLAEGADVNNPQVVGQMAAQFKGLDPYKLEAEHLQQFATIAGTSKAAGVERGEAMAMYGTLIQNSIQPERSANAVQKMIDRARTMRADPQAMEMIAKLGGNVNDIDMNNVSPLVALRNTQNMLSKARAEDRPAAMEAMYGKEYGPLVQILMQHMDDMVLPMMKAQRGGAPNLEAAVDIGVNGLDAKLNRAHNMQMQAEQSRREIEGNKEYQKQILKAEMKQANAPAWLQMLDETMVDANFAMGGDFETFVNQIPDKEHRKYLWNLLDKGSRGGQLNVNEPGVAIPNLPKLENGAGGIQLTNDPEKLALQRKIDEQQIKLDKAELEAHQPGGERGIKISKHEKEAIQEQTNILNDLKNQMAELILATKDKLRLAGD